MKGLSNGRCRDCGLPIRFATTAKGQRMPIDPQPNADGNVLLDDLGAVRKVLGNTEPKPSGAAIYIMHRATCPRPRRRR